MIIKYKGNHENKEWDERLDQEKEYEIKRDLKDLPYILDEKQGFLYPAALGMKYFEVIK